MSAEHVIVACYFSDPSIHRLKQCSVTKLPRTKIARTSCMAQCTPPKLNFIVNVV